MTSKLKFFLPLLLLTLILSSCLHHSFNITVNEDGSVDYIYTASGDSMDLYDGRVPLPEKRHGWKISQYVEVDSSSGRIERKFYYQAERLFASSDDIPVFFTEDRAGDLEFCDIYHPLQVEKQDLFFMVNYHFEFSFPSRNFTKNYGSPDDYQPDTEGEEAAMDEEKREKLWLTDVVTEMFMKSLRSVISEHPEYQIDTTMMGHAQAELQAYISLEIDKIWDKEDANEKAFFDSMLDEAYTIFKENLRFEDNPDIKEMMRDDIEIFSGDFLVSSDLFDESFSVKAYLPGKMRNCNADSADDFLLWEFSGEDITDSTVTMIALATVYRPLRLFIAGGILVVALGLFIITLMKPKPDKPKK